MSYTQPSVSEEASSDDGTGRVHSGVCLNNAQQSVIAQTLNNAQGVNFGATGGLDGITQSISAGKVDIQGGVKYEKDGSEDSTIHNWLSSLSTLNFEAKQFQNFEIAKKAPGAGQWLLESQTFKDWKNGESRKLWCYGIPCIYIYFDHRDQKKQDSTNLLSSLLTQLIRNQGQITKEVREIYQAAKGSRICPSSDEYLLMLKAQIKSFSRAFIVVDALDECLNDTETSTMDIFLKALHQLPGNTHILFTSRQDISIGQRIKADRELQIVASDDDLRAYFDSQFQSIEHLRRLFSKGVHKDEFFRENVLGAVVVKSQGMFLMAQLHMKSLASKHRLKDFESGVENLPKTPDEVYETALFRIGEQNEFKRGLAINALTWLVFAERALSITELRHALSAQDSDTHLLDGGFEIEELTSACAGLVVVDQGTDSVRLAHSTAEKYLQENRSAIFDDVQSKLAETCLAYLSHVEFTLSKLALHENEVDDCCKKYPFLSYAADHWGNHVASGVRGRVFKLAWAFLSDGQRLKSVIQVMANFRSSKEIDVSGLHIAAYFGLDKLMKKVIELNKGFKLNARTQRDETALHWAAFYRQRTFLKLLIDEGADLNGTDKEGKTALHRAIMNGDVSSVGLLLSSARRVNLKLEDSRGWTSLRWAAAHGHVSIVEMLLGSGAEIDAQDKDGWSALRWAAQRGHQRIVELLIRKHAVLETSSGNDQWTLLSWAAREGQDPLIQLLISKQVNLNATDANGCTALRWAVDYGHAMTAWLLIQARADINKPDMTGYTPLHSAAEKWQETLDRSLIWLLLANHADIHAQTNLGLTALHVASSKGHASVVWLLLENQAAIRAQTKLGWTVLHLASSEGHAGVVGLLLDHQVEINAQTKLGLTALHIASSKGHIRVVRLLLERGANPGQVDNNGRTALHCAVTEDYEAVTQMLIQKVKSLVDARDEEKRTALHVAASAGNLPIVTLLLGSGAEIDVRDREGFTPLHRAVSQQHEDLTLFLLRRGANVNIPNKKRWTILQSAANAGSTTITEAIFRSQRPEATVESDESQTS
ncbi:hypothetical protein EG329_001454 [Mollisiaceae sp. DMI_Dod_QoI]|nr:hypothetical protein EG329_001454 [Helotiales sp. DMI_Dod_QoI]